MRLYRQTLLLLFSFLVLCAVERVSVQLKWTPQFQFAGFYAAQMKGFYAEENLSVNLIHAELETDVIEEVVQNRAEFGIAMSNCIVEHYNGKPITSIAPLFQHSPFVLLTVKGRTGPNLSDLNGKRIMLQPEPNELMAMLTSVGIDSINSEFLPISWNWNDLPEGNVDAYPFYQLDVEKFLREHDSLEFHVHEPLDYGVDFYGDCMIVNSNFLRKNKSVVNAFYRATMKGWNYALSNPIELADYISSTYDINLSQSELLREAESVRKLTLYKYVEIGHQSRSRWQQITETFLKLGILPQEFQFDDSFIYSPGADTVIPQWLSRTAIAVMLFGCIMLVFNIHLKRKIRQKVAELHQSEGMFQTIFENSSQLIGILNQKGKLIATNPVALEMVKTTEKEVLGKPFWLTPWWRHSSLLQSELQENIRKTLRGEIVQSEVTHVDHEGKTRVIDLCLTPVHSSDDQIEYIIAVGYDMTHIHEIEERDRHLQKMEAIGTLAGGIAHDFNNILAGMVGYLDLAFLEEHGNDRLHEAHTEIQSAAERAKELVSQILTFSRQGSIEREPLQLSATVTEAMKLIRSSIPSTIAIDQNISSDDYILANSTSIHQVVMNLCTNAYHAMQAQNSGLLSVSLQTIETDEAILESHPGLPEGEYVELKVSDTGSGMDGSIQEQVFNPYFTTKITGKGTGLGLSLVHSIITGHDGVISLNSKPGVGTSFTALFPVIEHIPDEIEKLVEIPITVDNSSIHVMFVDDEDMIVNSATRFLTHAGFTVSSFTDSTEALFAFEQDPAQFSIVVSDMTMPVMNGVDLLMTIRGIRNDIPMILCSGYNEKEKELRELIPEICRYLQKPIAMKELVDEIRSVVQERSQP